MNHKPLFTIFSGLYNSEKVIERLFISIKQQTFRNFEWIVIDDASLDKTIDKVNVFVSEINDIEITVIQHTENKGVAESRREALSLAKGSYFVSWDHDDIQESTQLSLFAENWSKYDNTDVANIFAKVMDQFGNALGIEFPRSPMVSDYINTHDEYLIGFKGKGKVVEHHVCVKTEKYIEALDYFDENPQNIFGRHPNGGDIWGTLAYLGYKTIYLNNRVRTYYIGEPGRHTMSESTRINVASSVFLNKLMWVNLWSSHKKKTRIYWILREHFALTFYGILARYSFLTLLKKTKKVTSKFLVFFFMVPAWILSKKHLK